MGTSNGCFIFIKNPQEEFERLMKLIKAQVKNFQNILDSDEFEIDEINCLVGKNESGKTALLKALYHSNPIVGSDNNFNIADNYPINKDKNSNDTVTKLTYRLDPADIEAVENFMGCKIFKQEQPTLIVEKKYSGAFSDIKLDIDIDSISEHIVDSFADYSISTKKSGIDAIKDISQKLSQEAKSDLQVPYSEIINNPSDMHIFNIIFNHCLIRNLPKFMYLDQNQYHIMQAEEDLNTLLSNIRDNNASPQHKPLVSLLKSSGIDLRRIVNERDDASIAKYIRQVLGDVEESIQPVLKHWTQKPEYETTVNIYPDSKGSQPEIIPWRVRMEIKDTIRGIDIPFQQQSYGFKWFFSFLALHQDVLSENENIILLLDELGHSLHPSGQRDFIKFLRCDLSQKYQIIYTTHSPFMVDSKIYERIKFVEYLVDKNQGTKVTSDIDKVDLETGTVVPLQSALGYEIRDIFGPNFLVVEGKSDKRYIKIISDILREKGKEFLNPLWCIVPATSVSKVSTFISIFSSFVGDNKNIVALVDDHKNERSIIENIHKKGLLDKNKIIKYSEFIDGDEADVEDMFEDDFYVDLVNHTFGTSVSVADLDQGDLIAYRIKTFLEGNTAQDTNLRHGKVAIHLEVNIDSFEGKISEDTLGRFQNLFNKINKLIV